MSFRFRFDGLKLKDHPMAGFGILIASGIPPFLMAIAEQEFRFCEVIGEGWGMIFFGALVAACIGVNIWYQIVYRKFWFVNLFIFIAYAYYLFYVSFMGILIISRPL